MALEQNMPPPPPPAFLEQHFLILSNLLFLKKNE